MYTFLEKVPKGFWLPSVISFFKKLPTFTAKEYLPQELITMLFDPNKPTKKLLFSHNNQIVINHYQIDSFLFTAAPNYMNRLKCLIQAHSISYLEITGFLWSNTCFAISIQALNLETSDKQKKKQNIHQY